MLDAIRRSALKLMRQPGAKINAVPLESIPEGETSNPSRFTEDSFLSSDFGHPRRSTPDMARDRLVDVSMTSCSMPPAAAGFRRPGLGDHQFAPQSTPVST